MSSSFKAACIQLNAAREHAPTIAAATQLVREAAAAGAAIVLLPENATMIEPKRAQLFEKAAPEGEHPALPAFTALARELGIWLLVGSLQIKLERDERLANRGFLIAPDGRIQQRYDKLHMFDVEVGDGQSYRESSSFRPGEATVLAELPWGRLGMTICYDLRFPYLYRALAKAGADFISVPSAFTRLTGEAHWHVLLRARAIETGCYVLAPAQCGRHAEGRETYGHALIVDPWGNVLADAGTDPGFVIAEIDPAKVAEVRRMIPALAHDREFHLAEPPGKARAI